MDTRTRRAALATITAGLLALEPGGGIVVA